MIEVHFKEAMSRAGIVTPDPIIPDGKLRRIHIKRDRHGSRNGWYVLHGDGVPSGAFGSWKTGEKGTWAAKAYRDLSPAERVEHERRIDAAKKARQAEEDRSRQKAAKKAAHIWSVSDHEADRHGYLVRKRVKNHGLRTYKGCLVIPMRDESGELQSLQFIDSEGNKRFLSGGRKRGCYFLIGKPVGPVCVAEGYATGSSIHEATGYATACAFDAGNLQPVARILRTKFPDAEIVVCADNDLQTPGNPGLTYAREAALAIGGRLAVPPGAGDFNDFYTKGAQ